MSSTRKVGRLRPCRRGMLTAASAGACRYWGAAVPLDSFAAVFSFRSMAVETLGEAWRLGWKLTARCAFGNRDGMKSIRECIYRAPLDMQTLVWIRGPNFPLSRLESRLMCPECGSRRVSVLFDVPKVPVAARAKRATER